MSTRKSGQGSLILTAVVLGLSGCSNGFVPTAPKSWNPLAALKVPGSPKPEPTPKLSTDEKVDMQLAMIQSLEQKGDLDAAINACEELRKKHPRRADVAHRLAVLYDKHGDTQQANRHYQLAVDRAPRNAEILCDWAYGNYLRGEYVEAEKRLRKALELSPRSARAHNNLGLVLAHTKNYDAAVAEFCMAGCSQPQARVNLAHALIWDREWQVAEQQLVVARQMDPALKVAETSLARLHALQEKQHLPQATVAPAVQAPQGVVRFTPQIEPPPRGYEVSRLPSTLPGPGQASQMPKMAPALQSVVSTDHEDRPPNPEVRGRSAHGQWPWPHEVSQELSDAVPQYMRVGYFSDRGTAGPSCPQSTPAAPLTY